MLQMLVRRVLAMIPLFLLVTFAVFMMSSLLPGDPAVTLAGGADATAGRVEQIRDELGLNDPLPERYAKWLGNAVTGDFGNSLFERGDQSVRDEIANKFPITLSIAGMALVLGVLIGVPIGILAGMKPGGLLDRLSVGATSVSISVPNFLVAMVLAIVFAVQLGWLDAVGYTRITESPWGWFKSTILPASALALAASATLARQLRAALIDTMNTNYVRTAWATGRTPRKVVGKHALKNAAIPAVTVLGLQVSTLIGGTVLVEQIFSIPGLGTYLVGALLQKDVPVIQGVTVLFIVIQVVVTLLLDITYGFLNPKVRVT